MSHFAAVRPGWVLGLCFSLVSGIVLAAPANDSNSIRAVVNDQIITNGELQQQCKLAMVTNGEPANAQQQQALCRRTLQRMVDTELQRQYAQQRNLEPTADDFKRVRAASDENFKDIPVALIPVAENELRNELRWQRIINASIKPRVNVGVAEVDQLINDMARQRTVNERELAQILMTVPTPADETKVRQRMEDVQKQLAAGADFGRLAKSVSEGREAADSGRMGWFASGELNPELESKLDTLKPGQVSGLIRTPMGWHILKLLNVRDSAQASTQPTTQTQVLVFGKAIQSDAKAEKKQLKALNKLRNSMDDAKAVQGLMDSAETRAAWPDSKDLGWLADAEIPSELQPVINGLKPERASAVMQLNGSDVVVFKGNGRQVMPKALDGLRDRVYNHMFSQRTEQEARKFMRDLRQKAFVDIRAD